MQFEKIISVKRIGIQKTVDIEVNNKSHLFYANGIATSNSHSISYGTTGYWTAWVKHHFPFHFFTSWLYYAREKMEPQIEVRQLVSDAKYFDIEVCTPSILHLDSGDFGQFSLYQDKIRFGVNNIKGVGLASSKKLLKLVENKNIIEWTWYDFLSNLCSGKGKLSSTTVNGLIQVGAFSHLGTRTQLLYEYDVWNHLTEKEIKSLERCKDLISSLSLLYSKSTISRKAKIRELIKSLEKPPSPTDDTIYKISNWELDLLGVPLTYSKLDNCKGNMVSLADTTCKEITEFPRRNFAVAGELVKVNEYKIKQGSNAGLTMAFLTLEDDTGSIDIVAFSDVWNVNRHILYEGNTILLTCYLGKGGNVVKNVKNL